jgi:hypothetical protein
MVVANEKEPQPDCGTQRIGGRPNKAIDPIENHELPSVPVVNSFDPTANCQMALSRRFPMRGRCAGVRTIGTVGSLGGGWNVSSSMGVLPDNVHPPPLASPRPHPMVGAF